MEHRIKYMGDLIEDCKAAMAMHTDEPAFTHPEDRAKVMAALIMTDAANSIRKAGGRPDHAPR